MNLFAEAQKHIPGGVNSPVRAFRAVGGEPLFIKKGKGAYLYDSNGRRYLDFCLSWGPLILGHAPKGLVRRVQKASESGTSFGAPTANEVTLAKLIKRAFPSIEKVRLVSSGTEAVMSALRLARGVTGRKKILKIEGGYHGHADSLLVKAGSGGATLGVPDSLGVPAEFAELTFTIPFNNRKALENIFKKEGRNLAAFILEPVPANMGVIP
ncbi:MAG: aminotransferase class III-fold pyridoxal phosphate-dependent enzyme, partial [Candidatus Omnitrophica bacterium]|nr:aminotransferase class III-fold pyridoxal phosphate-dependent enzyme [Candidatus Omnitrophota bacterium]